MMENNRTLEYLGLAKCGLNSEDVVPLFNQIGRQPFPDDEADAHLAKCKARDQIVEKNKKAKAGKKPEEPVPLLDNIEQVARIGDDGNEVTSWVLLKNVQYKHLNLCMNPDIDDEIAAGLRNLMRRTGDDFGITLSGTGVTKETVDRVREQLVKDKEALPPAPEG